MKSGLGPTRSAPLPSRGRRIPVASRKPPRRWRDRRETRSEKRDESREKRDDRREKRGIRREIEERSEIEERNKESREALDKQEKLSQTGPGGSKMRPRSFQNHPRRPLRRQRVPQERSRGGLGKLLGLSWDGPECSWAPLG